MERGDREELQRCTKTFLRVTDSHFLESGDGFIGDITAF